MKQQPTVQVQAVLYHNEFAAIEKTVEALANAVGVAREAGTDLGAVSLVYGDASPEPVLDDGQVQQLQALCGDCITVDYRVFGFNSGFGKGNNLLAKDSAADYIVVMNPDIIVSPRYFADTLAPFADPLVGLVEARQTPIEHHKEYNPQTFETEWSSGACFMMPAGLFNALGGFDHETFFMYCEDVDLSWRVRLAGYKLFYQPLSPVWHAKRLSVGAGWQPTRSEVLYTAVSSMLLPYKWSRADLMEQRLAEYRRSENPLHQEAAARVERMKAEGKLPKQLDAAHRVGKFVGGYYADNRFVL